MIHLILLSGGSGTRLWPLSNESRSKQFLKVLRDSEGNPESMVQRTFRKITDTNVPATVTVATCESQAPSIKRQIKGDFQIVIEPERRDTAPAIMLACANLAWEQDTSKDDTVVVMPIDAYTEDSYYSKISELDQAVRANDGDIILLGVEPVFSSTKYGYITPMKKSGAVYSVDRFVEKPTKQLAEQLIGKGALWNCGVFAFKLSYLLDVVKKYGEFDGFEDMCSRYGELPKNSFDYEVVENTKRLAVVPCDVIWKDLGTWNTLSEEMVDAYAGRVVVDDETCKNVHAINETNIPVVIAGLKDAVVVVTPDGILVSGKHESAYIKELVKRAAATRPMYEQRCWGEYRVIDSGVYPDGSKALTKELVVCKGKQLSYQCHRMRNEVWTIVSGEGEVVIDDVVTRLAPGSTIKIPAGCKHSMRAFEEVHVIEVQIGDVLEEEDIERFGEYWNTASTLKGGER